MLTSSGSILIAVLERTWAEIRRRHPDLPDVVFITGSGLRRATSLSVDARWGHFNAERWVAGSPQPVVAPATKIGQGAALNLPHDRKPELFVAGECFAEGGAHTLTTILHEAAHALAAVRGVKDVSRQNKYHNRRFLMLAAELGLEWLAGQRPDSVTGFSEVQLSDATRRAYAAVICDLEATIPLYLDTFRPGPRATGGDGEKTFNRAKLICRCSPERIIRVSPQQAARGPILCGTCRAEFSA